MAIRVESYDPSWPVLFESIRSDLMDILAEVSLVGIEHVGSTSVPGMAAKPIIDVDVVVEADAVQPAVDALIAAGYRHLGDLGIADRQAMAAPDESPRRNVYVTLVGSLGLRNHLGVRDVLRSDPDLRARYAEVKERLAQDDAMDITRYTAAKSPILGEVLAAAGLTEAEIGGIDASNRPDAR